jgi:hypothetical protein
MEKRLPLLAGHQRDFGLIVMSIKNQIETCSDRNYVGKRGKI